jgi:hypothetical protein
VRRGAWAHSSSSSLVSSSSSPPPGLGGHGLLLVHLGALGDLLRDARADLRLGREQDGHRLGLHAGRLLDDGDVLRGLDEVHELHLGRLRVRDLAAAEAARDLHLVAVLEEAADVLRLRLEIVIVGLGAELHFLQLHLHLTLASFALLLLFLVLELAEVHDLADRRHPFGVHLDEIEIGFTREAEGLVRRQHTEHLLVGADDAHFRDADAVVRTGTTEGARLTARIEAGAIDRTFLLLEGLSPFVTGPECDQNAARPQGEARRPASRHGTPHLGDPDTRSSSLRVAAFQVLSAPLSGA